GGALAAAAGLDEPVGGELIRMARQSFVDSLQATAVVTTALSIALAAVVLATLRRGRSLPEPPREDASPACPG
ncbi:MAG TPA: MFS transporter, partial [Planctomycetota bacterium]|nr:MFS transporter [Planctomycetota bacterium]